MPRTVGSCCPGADRAGAGSIIGWIGRRENPCLFYRAVTGRISFRSEPSTMAASFSTIEAAVAAIARGETVIVVDAEDRENEGDFVCAAEMVTPEVVNFMITQGAGNCACPSCPRCPSGSSSRRWSRPTLRFSALRTPCRSITLAVARASPRRNGPRRSAPSSTRRASRPISCVLAICFRWWPRKAACYAVPGTPRPRSI